MPGDGVRPCRLLQRSQRNPTKSLQQQNRMKTLRTTKFARNTSNALSDHYRRQRPAKANFNDRAPTWIPKACKLQIHGHFGHYILWRSRHIFSGCRSKCRHEDSCSNNCSRDAGCRIWHLLVAYLPVLVLKPDPPPPPAKRQQYLDKERTCTWTSRVPKIVALRPFILG